MPQAPCSVDDAAHKDDLEVCCVTICLCLFLADSYNRSGLTQKTTSPAMTPHQSLTTDRQTLSAQTQLAVVEESIARSVITNN